MRIKTAITGGATALLAALVVTVGAGAGMAGAATGGSATPEWGAQQPYSNVTLIGGTTPSSTAALINSVACPSYGACVAAGYEVGASGTQSAAVMVENGAGQWAQPFTAPLPNNAASSSSPELAGVACSSATSCLAVGAYVSNSDGSQPFVVPFTVSGATVAFGTPQQVSLPGNALTNSEQSAFLDGVACTAGGCTAVGAYETNASTPVWTAITAAPNSSGAWHATAVAAPSGATTDNVLSAISCPSGGPCEAVGNSGDSSGNMMLWAVQVNSGVAATAKSITIAGASSESDETPELGNPLDASYGLAAISCPSASACVAAGTFEGPNDLPEAALVPINEGTPAQGSPMTVNGANVFAQLEGISCTDASDCTADGMAFTSLETESAFAATETAGSWSTAALEQSGGAFSSTFGAAAATTVACTSPGICVTAGINFTESLSGSTAAVNEGSFFAYSALPPTITTTSLPVATVGKPYSATLASSGGLGTPSWTVTLGSLPAGLSLDSATGVISGTPTSAGQSGLALTTTYTGPPSLSATLSTSLTVGPAATVTLAYSKLSARSVMLVLSCSGAPCTGSYELTGVEHLRGRRPIAVDAKAKKKRATKRTVTLAGGSYSIGAGAARSIDVKLNAKGLRLLRRLHRISGTLTLTPTGATAPALVKVLKFRS